MHTIKQGRSSVFNNQAIKSRSGSNSSRRKESRDLEVVGDYN
jgi:hypothetical protein